MAGRVEKFSGKDYLIVQCAMRTAMLHTTLEGYRDELPSLRDCACDAFAVARSGAGDEAAASAPLQSSSLNTLR